MSHTAYHQILQAHMNAMHKRPGLISSTCCNGTMHDRQCKGPDLCAPRGPGNDDVTVSRTPPQYSAHKQQAKRERSLYRQAVDYMLHTPVCYCLPIHSETALPKQGRVG